MHLCGITQKPKSVCVIGGGYIGAELAFFLHEMGSKVTVLDSKANLADREDEEVAEEFMKVFTSIVDVKPEVNIVRPCPHGHIPLAPHRC